MHVVVRRPMPFVLSIELPKLHVVKKCPMPLLLSKNTRTACGNKTVVYKRAPTRSGNKTSTSLTVVYKISTTAYHNEPFISPLLHVALDCLLLPFLQKHLSYIDIWTIILFLCCLQKHSCSLWHSTFTAYTVFFTKAPRWNARLRHTIPLLLFRKVLKMHVELILSHVWGFLYQKTR